MANINDFFVPKQKVYKWGGNPETSSPSNTTTTTTTAKQQQKKNDI